MTLVRTTSGGEEWHCPTCGRKLLISWPPNYRKVVIDPGDIGATHSGGTGGLAASAFAVDEDELSRLETWEKRLDELGFDGWWK